MRQRSIFEFTGGRRLRQKDGPAYIDLTNEDDIEVEMKRETEGPRNAEREDTALERHQDDALVVCGSRDSCKKEVGGLSIVKEQSPTPDMTLGQQKQDSDMETAAPLVLCPVCSISITILTIENRTRHVEECLRSTTAMGGKALSEIVDKQIVKSSKRKELKDVPPVIKERQNYVNKKQKVTEKNGTKVIKHPTKFSKPRDRPAIPDVKIMSFPVADGESYEVTMDAFSFRHQMEITQYFLSHFHSDHYGGINKKWCYERVFNLTEGAEQIFDDSSEFRKIIYCSSITGTLLTMRFGIDPRFIKSLEYDKRYIVKRYDNSEVLDGGEESNETHPGLYVIPITANHCPGSCIFLFDSISVDHKRYKILHCGDFRACPQMLAHPALQPFCISDGCSKDTLDKIYLDTTYMSSKYNFPDQGLICESVAAMFHDLVRESKDSSLLEYWFGVFKQSRITDFLTSNSSKKKKFLVLVGTYVVGKERLAIAISKRLQCPIYASNVHSRDDKHALLKAYDDEYLTSVLTTDDLGTDSSDCVVHLVPMRIVSNGVEINNYFNHNKYFDHFERCVGLRPTGWTFSESKERPPISVDNTDEEAIFTQLDSELVEDVGMKNSVEEVIKIFKVMKSKPNFSIVDDILSQSAPAKAKGKRSIKHDSHTVKAYAIPYSEHSSYRELCYFAVFLNSRQIIPTVNIHNEWSIMRMQAIIDKWDHLRDIILHKNLSGIPQHVHDLIKQLSINEF